MTAWLWRAGHEVNRKRVQRLMRLMGLEAVYPKPRLSMGGAGHRVYPYLLRNVSVERVNQVWSRPRTASGDAPCSAGSSKPTRPGPRAP